MYVCVNLGASQVVPIFFVADYNHTLQQKENLLTCQACQVTVS